MDSQNTNNQKDNRGDRPLPEKAFSLGDYSSNLFPEDSHIGFIYRKSQKLAVALYFITDFFSDREPLKWNIRDKSNLLIQTSLSLALADRSEKKDLGDCLKSYSIEILSLAEIAYLTKIISEMNFAILKKEFENLLEEVKTTEEPMKIDLNFLIEEMPPPKNSRASFWPEKEEEKLVASIPLKGDKKASTLSAAKVSSVSQSQNHSSKLSDRTSSRGLSSANVPDRRQSIIDLLKDIKDGESLSIKDISGHIRNCGEKTIQRELTQMVEDGVLKKSGERRWSRYSL